MAMYLVNLEITRWEIDESYKESWRFRVYYDAK